MNARLQNKLSQEKTKVEEFIDSIRVLFMGTPDETERMNRLEVFDSLLLLATYADPHILETEFQEVLPPNENNDTLNYMCQKLREINGICKNALSDEHDIYQNLFSTIKYPTAEKKHAVRNLLSKTISETIFEKTQTYNIYPANKT